jgi:NTE family protein
MENKKVYSFKQNLHYSMVYPFLLRDILQNLVLGILFSISLVGFAQETKPKIALVLSGGGAKGIAHVPLLQTLDSLNIVPDLIIGTSMGSVIGGLYSMGYSGNDLAKITHVLKWGKLFGGSTNLNDVSIEEKDEFKKYLLDFDVVKGKAQVSSYLLNDQNLRDVLFDLTYPVYNIDDFDRLAIPFRSVTADIVNGERRILGEGSLRSAMRASMSIPGVFEPMLYGNSLLVDGGILDNFPTDIAKSMGADIIIGSDVSGFAKPLEELDNLSAVLLQSIMLASYSIYPQNRELCDILIDHVPNLSYTAADFGKSDKIYEQGKIGTQKGLNQLVQLSKTLQNYRQRPHVLPYLEDRIVFDTIVFNKISASNLPLVRARANIKAKEIYSKKDITRFMKRTMGTNIFKKLTYDTDREGGRNGIILTGFEKSKHQLRGSVHYDRYRGVGIIGNYSGRNVLGKASRLLFSVDIAEQPKFMAQYRKNFGNLEDWWWKIETIGMQLKQEAFVDGNTADVFRERSFVWTNQINYNINSLNSFVGVGLNYRHTDINPTVATDIDENILLLSKYFSSGINVNIHYVLNSMNEVFYPTKGNRLKLNIKRSLRQNINATYSDLNTTSVRGVTNGFTQLNLNFEHRRAFNQRLTGIVGISSGITLADNQKENEASFFEFGYPELYLLGGNLPIQRADSFAFQGLNEDELSVSQFMMVKLGLQFSTSSKFFITPQLNIASVGFDTLEKYTDNFFTPSSNWQALDGTSILYSAGATISYKSILGPIDLNTTWTNDSKELRVFLNIGIPFNR